VSSLLDIPKELWLGGARVSEQKHVNIPSEAQLPVDILWNAAEERKSYCRVDILVAVEWS
jgi:hypothetical protein